MLKRINLTKEKLLKLALLLLVAFLVGYLPTGYYCRFPGRIISLNDRVIYNNKTVENSFHMTTVTSVRASLPILIFGHIAPNVEVVPKSRVIPEGWTSKEYELYSSYLMKNSHNDAKLAIASLLNLEYEEINSSAYILRTIEGSPAYNILSSGDIIVQINDDSINSTNEAREVIKALNPFQEVSMVIKRDEEILTKNLVLASTNDGTAYLGVTIIELDKVVNIKEHLIEIVTGNITGPSAGSMLTMEILNKMGYISIPDGIKVAGTGTINYKGEIGAIGGINQKIVAAHRSGVDIYFMPKVNLKDIYVDYDKYENLTVVPVNYLYEIIDYFQSEAGAYVNKIECEI